MKQLKDLTPTQCEHIASIIEPKCDWKYFGIFDKERFYIRSKDDNNYSIGVIIDFKNNDIKTLYLQARLFYDTFCKIYEYIKSL